MQKTIPQSKSQDNFSFFAKKINVLYIKDDFVQIANVSLSKNPIINKQFKINFNESNLKENTLSLLAKIKTDSIYLLLGSEFAYVVSFNIPLHIQGSEERTYVYRKVSELVPEILEDKDWDYKETIQGQEEKQIIAFALVKEKYGKIINTLQNLPLEIKAVESEEVSLTRHENPIIGIALKNDIKGNDNKSLNIVVSKKKDNSKLVAIFSWIVVAISGGILTLLLDMIFRGWLY